MILLSICIPTFNRAEYLRSSLANILSQAAELENPAQVEVVVSDNASDDGTGEVLKEFKRAGLVTGRNSANLGHIANLHKVIKMASGAYCWLMGDDDHIVPGALKKIVKIIAANPGAGFFYVNYSKDIDPSPVIKLPGDLKFGTGGEYVDYGLARFSIAEWDPAKFTFFGSMIVDRKKWLSAGEYGSLAPQAYIVHSYLPSAPVYLISEPLLVQNTGRAAGGNFLYLWLKIYWFMGRAYGRRAGFAKIIARICLVELKSMLGRLCGRGATPS